MVDEMSRLKNKWNIVNPSSRSLGAGTFRYLGGDAPTLLPEGRDEIAKYRELGKHEEILRIRREISRNNFLEKKAFKINPLKPRNRMKGVSFDFCDLKTEIAWSMGYIKTNYDIICIYNQFKATIYKLYFEKKFDAAIQEIQIFRGSSGFSYSNLDLEFFISQELGGIDLQKRLRSDILERYGESTYPFVSSIISERCEPDVYFENFCYRLARSIEQWPLSEKYRYFYNYLLSASISSNEELVGGLINIGTTASIFDLFDIINDIYQQYPDHFAEDDAQIIHQLSDKFYETLDRESVERYFNNLLEKFDESDPFIRSNISKEILFLRYTPNFKRLWLSFKYISTDNFDDWKTASLVLENNILPPSGNSASRIEIYNHIKHNLIEDALILTVDLCYRHPELSNSLPVKDLAMKVIIEEDNYRGLSERSSILDIYLKRYQDAQAKERASW